MNKISCCIITQDQADRLVVALKNIQSYVDEIVIIDSGSTDNTADVSKEFGTSFFTRPLDGDFGAQRNFSIEKATNDWIFVLDTDELVEFSDRYTLKKIIEENPKNDGFKILRKNLLDNQQTGSEYDFDWQLRLFNRSAKYIAKVHEVPTGLKNVKEVKEICMIIHSKSKEEQKQHLLFQKTIIENTINKLKEKTERTEIEEKELNYQEKMLEAWSDWWRDANN